MRRRRSGIDFRGEGIQTERQVSAMLFDDADGQNDQRLARIGQRFDFGKRYLRKMSHSYILTIRSSLSRAATRPILGRLPRSRSPPHPNTVMIRPVFSAWAAVNRRSSASSVWA